MTNKTINKIQKRIINLLPKDRQSKLNVLLSDCCSEISRLVAGWIRETNQTCRLIILKGNKVCDTQKSHDILAVINHNYIHIIDPTVWQFFPRKKSILILQHVNFDIVLKKLNKLYKCDWQISEDIKSISLKEQKKYLDIINQNINESLSMLLKNNN